MENCEGESSPPSAVAPAEILLQKIQELELGHAHLKQEMSKLATSNAAADRYRKQRSHSTSPHRRPRRSIGGMEIDAVAAWKRGSASFGRHSSRLQRESGSRDSWTGGGGVGGGGGGGPAAVDLTDKQYLNIMQSMGQSVHIHDDKYHIIYWNKSAEKLYGFLPEEALGEDVIALLTDPRDHDAAYKILDRVLMGENWTGQFPVVSRTGKKFLIVATNTPLYDDAGTILGGICVSTDSAPFRHANSLMSDSEIDSCKLGRVHHKPLQAKFPSKLLYSPSEVSEPEMMHGEEDLLRDGVHGDNGGASTSGVDTYHSAFGLFSSDQESVEKSEMHLGISKVSLKADSLSGKRSLSWQETKSCRSGWPGSQYEQENESVNYEVSETNRTTNYEASGYWSSSVKVNSYSSASSSSSSSNYAVNAVDIDPRSVDYDIMWDELTIGEQIGQGSCGVVYRALWYGSDVAVKIFSRLEYSDEVILSFKQEVSLMKRLRHPNILLFMGAVTSSERLCIVTELLPRGSLFGLLKKTGAKLEKRRLIQMALDIARGMNYLHRYNPPIIHRDLKSSNLLVDKNWTVKVGDFGLSRLKHETYLTTRTGKGTPQWMAPEVLRSEPSNEKADVYSFGVILWELVTQKIPWDKLNPMQVIGAVGFMNQRLGIPDDVEPQWASLIESCFNSEPKSRPSFQELVEQLKDMQKKNAVQVQAGRNAQKEV